MKSAPSLALVICLLMSALPVGAQERTETPMLFAMRDQTTQGPVAKAITAEAIRLAADPLNPVGSTQPPVQVDAEHSVFRDILHRHNQPSKLTGESELLHSNRRRAVM